jgi:hypothetical protein
LWDNRILTGKKITHIRLHLIMYLVAHAQSKPPGPTNLFREEDNYTYNLTTQVMQEEVDQVVPFLPTRNNLSENISSIVNRRHIP